MDVIGAGFGRTGTMSLRAALTELGFSPCYHMIEVFRRPSHIKQWQAAADGRVVDWHAFLDGYRAGLDYPLSTFYEDLMTAFPDAKVILTVRDPEHWYESTYQTIYQGAAVPGWMLWLLPPFRGFSRMVQATVWQRLFDGQFQDREYAIRVFTEHIAQVRRRVPKDKLLVFNVKEGWEPLCEFLGTEPPNKRFPHVNDRNTTRRLFLLSRAVSAMTAFAVVGLLVWFVASLI